MPSKRLIVLLLTVGIAVLGGVAIAAGTAEPRHLSVFAVGIALGTIYVVRGGSLPDWAYQGTRRRRVNRDDDPSNLPPRVYLPILLAVIALASLAVWIFAR